MMNAYDTAESLSALIPEVGRAIVDCYEAARAAYPGVEDGEH